ncbi:LysR family transcriptional regulator [Alicyclobacillus dauci]|uniref:LysR family transcriptional regulator n=1 Tax=Alicyclobacillus dauci TaxID=1475485 RepID=A0ABY6Z5U6_9BACL|nr:LysR family transcriptional regulator [Alicyclobacillus dauci]WAH37987.1 LysR family transcriptional regulator [Alicyclobacillus dauci]
MDDLENIATFVCVASNLSFIKAANSMNLRQPSVTARIQRLEDRLGVELFIRNKNHSIHLSEEGRAFLPFAKQMIQLMQEAEDKVRSVKQIFEGQVRIGVTPSWSVNVLPRVLGAVRERYPDVGFYVINGTTKGIKDMILGNEVDIGLVSYDIFHRQLERICVHETPWVLVCNPRHRLIGRAEIDIEEILHEPLVTYEQSTDGWREIQRIYGSYNAVPNVVAQLEQLEAVKVLLNESSCVSLLPLICVNQELQEGRLASVQIKQLSDVKTKMSIIYLKTKSSYLLVNMIQNMILDYFTLCSHKLLVLEQPTHGQPF